ncbi:hypothetical protein [Variovorax saccharolyticus]|uniref:hypothetical protein n=1 Tax=Variovorax saccharolyticus TaxID=3053516 RepID=UPI002575D0C4|nr:hypothetical protein [Variovorax sp. J31P216]MDM0029141.1 hypothetical protein [Variovorax sp. J31P216]
MQWTQEQAIAFESARECITAMVAVHTAELAEEKQRPEPRPEVMNDIRDEINRLFAERAGMHVNDDETVRRVREIYGPKVRAAMEQARQSMSSLP